MLKSTIWYYFKELRTPTIWAVVFGLWLYFAEGLVSFLLAFVLLAVAAAWWLWRLLHFMRALRFNKLCWDKFHDAKDKKGVHVYTGGNRTGKSLNGYITLGYKAMHIEEQVYRDVPIYYEFLREHTLNKNRMLEFGEFNEFYKFYNRHTHLIPALVTNVRVTRNGKYWSENPDLQKKKSPRKKLARGKSTPQDNKARIGSRGHPLQSSMKLTIGHLAQLDKLPRPCAVGMDESSSMIDNNIHKDDMADYILTSMIRFYNHYTGDKSLYVFMEQNFERAFKGYRDSLQGIVTAKGVDMKLEPRRLNKKLDRMYERFKENARFVRIPIITKLSFDFAKIKIWRGRYKNPRYAKRILDMDDYIKKIGVLVCNFLDSEAPNPGKKLKDHIPRNTPFNYNNRFFRTSYLAKNQEIKLSQFKHELMHEDDVDEYLTVESYDTGDTDKNGKPIMKSRAVYRGQSIAVQYENRKTELDTLRRAAKRQKKSLKNL